MRRLRTKFSKVSFARNSAGAPEITGTNNYYPFGLNHIGGGNMSSFSNYHSYKFGGKELQETGMYDFGARMYMPDLGRWGVIDPMAEAMRRYSPYNYAFNNPISFIDPDGMAPMHQFAMISDARPDTTSGWTNPGWLGRGTSDGINYGATLGSGGGGSVYESEYGTVYTGSEARDAFSALVSGGDPTPRPKKDRSLLYRIGRFFGLVGSSKKGSLEVGSAVATDPFDPMAGVRNDKGGLQNVNILAVPYMLLEAGITEGLMQLGVEGHRAYNTSQLATLLYAMKAPQVANSEMGILNSGNNAAKVGGFGSFMEASEAARYAKYWQSYSPKQVTPGTMRLDWLRESGRTGG